MGRDADIDTEGQQMARKGTAHVELVLHGYGSAKRLQRAGELIDELVEDQPWNETAKEALELLQRVNLRTVECDDPAR